MMNILQITKVSQKMVLLTFFFSILACCYRSSALSADGLTLMALKSTMEDDAGSLANWDESSGTPCMWTGVGCDGAGNVVSLNLSGLNLAGNISGAIGCLGHLTTLSLDSNNFTGPLPEELCLLTHLSYLNITDNQFIAELPSGLSNLTELEVLDCYNNMMSGNLPLAIVSLQKLQHIHLGGNNFVGNIPSDYGNLTEALQYLALSGNLLTGSIPPELGNLSGLNYLYLGWYNSFEGGIPPELGKLSNLILLDIASCELTGDIPSELANLTQLGSLFLYQNDLSGSLPPEFGSLSNLLSLDLSDNQLTGPIPDTYEGMKNLTLMSFFENHLVGQIPPMIGDLPNLMEFQIWENNFTGEIPQRLGSSGLLKLLDVSNNRLTGGLPPDLCLGNQLTRLIAMDNDLSGPVPEGLGSCSSLLHVRVSGNFLNGSIPAGLFDLPNAIMLQLNDNRFSGPLPSVFRLPALTFFDLSRNELNGSIPDAVGDLVSVLSFHLEGNLLTGSIPSSIYNMSNVYELDLSSNSLTGQIPLSLGNCSMLSKLDLSRNGLEGEIPITLVNLPVLAMLNLSRNLLSGPIPEAFEYIQSLTQVDFSYNNLSGPVPDQGQARSYSVNVYEGNPLLCGGLLVPCSAISHSNTSGSTSRRSKLKRGGPNLLAWVVGAVFSGLSLVVILVLCCLFRRKGFCFAIRLAQKERTVRQWEFTPFQRLDFTADELMECLCEENIIGKGGAGTVYKGQMPNGEMVAVKKLACSKGTSTHDHGFSAEIRTLGKIRHRYIVKLLGFCTKDEMNLLIYEYMPNGSLGEFLHGAKSGLLDWSTRYNIAVQAANGLCYLHHDCSPIIVHRDVKSNNILLDSNLGAHVADFGLAKLFQDIGTSESMSSIAGSYGYIAPEYAYTLKVNEKSDIYSFGVVLMELLTGKRPIEPEFGDGADIVQWMRTKVQTKEGVVDILDPRMSTSLGVVPLQEVIQVLRVALLCSSDHPAERPTMRDVVQMLSDIRPGLRTSAGITDNTRHRQLNHPQMLLTDDFLAF